MDKYEIRRVNLRTLLATQCEGAISILADKLDKSPSYVSRMLYAEDREGKKRIGEDMVSTIEEAFGLQKHQLDDMPRLFDASSERPRSAARAPTAEVARINQVALMADVKRVRALIGEGRTDAEILVILSGEQPWESEPGDESTAHLLQCLAGTMQRASTEDRVVQAQEVLTILDLFRALWKVAATNGDATKVEDLALELLSEIVRAEDVDRACSQLHADLSLLASRVTSLAPDFRVRRKLAEEGHLRNIDGAPVICTARAGVVVANMLATVYKGINGMADYAGLFPPEQLRQCRLILVGDRPRWADLLNAREAESELPRFG